MKATTTRDLTPTRPFVTVCGAQQRVCATEAQALHEAKVLSAALCPQVAEARAGDDDVIAVCVDGTAYHPSLADLVRSPFVALRQHP